MVSMINGAWKFNDISEHLVDTLNNTLILCTPYLVHSLYNEDET